MFIIPYIILGCCSRRDYTSIDDLSQQSSADAEHINIKCGYSYNRTKKIIFHIISICMLGVPYLAIHWSINLKMLLLMTPSPLSTSDTVLVVVSISKNKFIYLYIDMNLTLQDIIL